MKNYLSIPNCYNRRALGDKGYTQVLVREGYGVQGSEINEIQSIQAENLRGVADAFLHDGDIIADAAVVVDRESGAVRAAAGKIYIKGRVRDVPEAVFAIPPTGSVLIGVRLIETVVSELEDPELLNPAVGCRAQGMPGAWRRKEEARWGFSGDGQDGELCPVYAVDDGELRPKEAPPAFDSTSQSIAGYDRDSTGGGSYVVEGLTVRRAADDSDGAQVYTVAEGRARVNGYGVTLPTARRVLYPATPDLRFVDTEIHKATADASTEQGQRISVAHPPLKNVVELRITAQKTVPLTHGSYSGAADSLPDTAVVDILEVRQGDTVYEPGIDYAKTGDTVNWSPVGNEPATGSSYSATYTYMTAAEPQDQDEDGFSVRDAVEGSSIILKYNQALPRIDRLCLTGDGLFQWIQGVAAERNARAPAVPESLLPLARVCQTWRAADTASCVTIDAVRVVPFGDFAAINDTIDRLWREVSRNRLEMDAGTREAGARVGIQVDPLLDDSMRDLGAENTAAVYDGILTLPIAATAHSLSSDLAAPVSARWTPKIVLEQPYRTGEMKVNPYQAFERMPATVEISPSVDHWVEQQQNLVGTTTRYFETGHYVPGNSTLVSQSANSSNQVVSSATTELAYLRQIEVNFNVCGFGAGEILDSVTFDGLDVTPAATLTADAAGNIRGAFHIPAGVPSGAKGVIFTGRGGSTASASFVGQGSLTVQNIVQARTITRYWTDPLAESLVFDVPKQLGGFDFWFVAKGAGPVRVQLRDTDNGYPGKTVLAETRLDPGEIVITGGGHTRALFSAPVALAAGTEYAMVIMCDDAVTAVAIGEVGQFDAMRQQYVSAQPYQVGVLYSSANGSAWTAHQTKDLAFRALEADFTASIAEVDLGNALVDEATDLMVLALEDVPRADARVEYDLTLPDGGVQRVAAGQPVRLAAAQSGGVAVKAHLSGKTGQASPVLHPGTQVLAGRLRTSAVYQPRAVPAINATRAVLVYEALVPSGAAVTPELRADAGEWVAMTVSGTAQQGDGWVEFRFTAELSGVDEVRYRLTLAGTSLARPQVRNLKFLALNG